MEGEGSPHASHSWQWSGCSLPPAHEPYEQVVQAAARRDAATSTLGGRHFAEGVPPPDQQSFFRRIAALSVYSEDIGGFAAEEILRLGLPGDLRARTVRAMWDEVRHSDIFHRLAVSLGEPGPIDPLPQHEELLATFTLAETELEFALLHTELEGLALDVFRLVADALPDNLIGATYARVAIDEASHVRLGLDIVRWLSCSGQVCERARVEALLSAATSQAVIGRDEAIESLASVLRRTPHDVAATLHTRQARRHRVALDVIRLTEGREVQLR